MCVSVLNYLSLSIKGKCLVYLRGEGHGYIQRGQSNHHTEGNVGGVLLCQPTRAAEEFSRNLPTTSIIMQTNGHPLHPWDVVGKGSQPSPSSLVENILTGPVANPKEVGGSQPFKFYFWLGLKCFLKPFQAPMSVYFWSRFSLRPPLVILSM